ncbi:hypothetical protein [Candidatus Lokiarchaeum ossiferum]
MIFGISYLNNISLFPTNNDASYPTSVFNPPQSADNNTILYCNMENDNFDSMDKNGVIRGTWSYMTPLALSGTTSLSLNWDATLYWDLEKSIPEGTIECLFRPTGLSPYSNTYIFQILTESEIALSLFYRPEGALVVGYYSGNVYKKVIAPIILEDDKIYHIACSWGSNGIGIWVNGNQLILDEKITSILLTTARYYGLGVIKKDFDPPTAFGDYDEFRLSNIQKTFFSSEFTELSDIVIPSNSSEIVESLPFFNESSVPIIVGIIVALLVISVKGKRFFKKSQVRTNGKKRDKENQNQKKKIDPHDPVVFQKFCSILVLSHNIDVELVAESLGITEKQLQNNLEIWKEKVSFEMRGETISLNRMNDYLSDLDAHFLDWELGSHQSKKKISFYEIMILQQLFFEWGRTNLLEKGD